MFDPATETTAITLILALTVLSAIWMEKNIPAFRKIGAAALSIIIGMLLSNIGVIPGESVVYDFFRGPGVLAGITLFLLTVDLDSIRRAGGPMLKAFLLGACGAALGGAVMGLVFADAIGPETWKLSGQFAATYIGGGVNFAAVGQELDTSGEYFTAGVAADVIVTAIWLIACITIPEFFGKKDVDPQGVPANAVADVDVLQKSRVGNLLNSSGKPITLWDLALLLSIVMSCLWLSRVISTLVPLVPMIIWLTTLVLILAQFPVIKRISGGLVLGNYLLLLFLATNGAISVVARIIEIGPVIFYFALGTVLIHGVIIFAVGMMLKIDATVIAIASQANVGGASSAMAIAGARGVPHLILPGIAVGLLGTALGNYVGLVIANVMRLVIV
ncbi:DUF819 domain-containing protein [Chromatocurvus halotolerans]|uniref:Putative membrane protein n=1 Tax=Chromatocurvus halotolerans TaxID=1132028 RepID=A0A4R2KT88_9GAMM|nr:DUF819 family protein [Chromatocurvus halotolerans]TCO76993.1 putative membrane protein [Chromatocurvus halotolerans]